MLLLLFLAPGSVIPPLPPVIEPFPIRTAPVYQYTGRPSRDDYREPRWDMYCTDAQPDFEIDPDSTQRFRFPLAADLDGATITAVDFVLQDGLAVDSSSFTSSSVIAYLSGASCGGFYRVTVRYTTSDGQQRDKTFTFVGRDT